MWGFFFYAEMSLRNELGQGVKAYMLPLAKGSGRAVSWLLALFMLSAVCVCAWIALTALRFSVNCD